ncbi:MAG: rhodanese-like domain-containing protein [Bacillota bacterium]
MGVNRTCCIHHCLRPRDKKVVIVCASGSRSPQVAEYLVQLGYPEVYNLSDGLMVWTGELVK